MDLSGKKYKETRISLVILSSTQNIKGYLIKEEEIDGVRCTHGEKRNAYGILVGILKERDHLEGLGIDSRIILKGILKKLDERTWTGSIRFTRRTRGGLL